MRTTTILFTAALLVGAARPAAAQDFLLPDTPAKGFWVEALRSDFKGFDTKLPTSVWYLSGRAPLTQKLSGVLDIPFAYAKMDIMELGDETSSVLGNPYIGVEYAAAPRLVLSLGMRAPLTTADEESFADALALIADPLRAEAFADNTVSLGTSALVNYPVATGLTVRGRLGVTGLFYTGTDAPENDAAIDYGVAGTWERGIGRVALGLSGRWYATSDAGTFGETSLHHAGLSADVLVAGVRPGVSLRLPVDQDYRDFVGPTVGLYLQVPLR